MILSRLLCAALILFAVQPHTVAARPLHQESLSAGESTSESAVSANEQLESSYSNTGPGETPGPVINRTDFAGASQGDDPPFLAHEPQTTPAAPLPSNQSTAEETQQASGSYFPYAVALRRGPYGEHLCSGVLIGPQYALTAAKCLDPRLDFTSHRPSIIIGAYSGNNSNAIAQFEVMAVTSIAFHSKFGTFGEPDLAILKLDRASPQSPIGLATKGFVMPPKLSYLRWKVGSLANQLDQMVEQTTGLVRNSNECGAKPGMTFCTIGECPHPGDQGGPVFYHDSLQNKDLLVGIVGSNPGCNPTHQQATHTDVLPHMPWIEGVISGATNLGRPPPSPLTNLIFRGSVLDGMAG